MLTLLLPILVWAALGMLMTRSLVAAPGIGAAGWAFIVAGPVIGAVYALRVVSPGEGDALYGWLVGLGFAGLILALGVSRQASALARLDPRRRRLLEIGMLWLMSLAGGLLGFVFAAAMVLAFG
jgi:hypothetical protein